MIETEDSIDSEIGGMNMSRSSTLIVAFFLTASSVTATTLWIISRRVPPEVKRPDDITSKQAAENQQITFTDKMGTKGTTKDGAPFSTHVYESSDGVVVTVIRENRDSPAKADRALQKRVKEAVRIVDQGPKLGEVRKRVGERVVAIFALDDSQKEQASVFWTDGQQLYSIESPSLKHALEFEKQFYK